MSAIHAPGLLAMIPVVAFLSTFALLVWSYSQGRVGREVRAFQWLLYSFLFWQGPEALSWLGIWPGADLLLRIQTLGWIPALTLYANFVHELSLIPRPRWWPWQVALTATLALSGLTTDFVIAGHFHCSWWVMFVPGPGHYIALACCVLWPGLYSGWLTLHARSRSTDPLVRGQLQLLFWGMVGSSGCASLANAVIPEIFGECSVPLLGSSLVSVMPFFAFISLLREHFLIPSLPAALGGILGQLREGVILLDRSGVVVESNRTARSLLGVVVSSGSRISDVLQAPSLDWSTDFPHVELRLMLDGRLRVLSVSQQSLLERGRPIGRLVLIRDISRESELDEEILRAQRDRIETSRTRLMSDARIAERILSPLDVIVGHSEVLAETAHPLHAQLATHAETILSAAGDLRQGIRRMLAVSQMGNGILPQEDRRFHLRGVLKGLDEEYRRRKKQARIRFVIAAEVPDWVVADAGRIGDALRELIDNALQAAHDEPVRVDVKLHSDPAKQDDVRIHLLFTVCDHGQGLPLQELERCLRGESGGTGFLLAQRIAKSLGGELGLESVPGEGLLAWLLVPVLPAIDQPLRPIRDSMAHSIGKRVLVVDSDEINREQTRSMLDELGCAVEEWSVLGGGDETPLPKIKVDLALLRHESGDVLAGQLSGLRERIQSWCPVIVLSSLDPAMLQVEAVDLGMDDLLPLPLDRSRVRATVLHWLTHDVPLAAPDDVEIVSMMDAVIPVDLPGLVEAFSGDRNLALHVLQGFIEQFESHVQQLGDNPSLNDLSKESNRVRGGALNLRAERLAVLAAQADQLAGNGRREEAWTYWNRMRGEMAEIRRWLDKLVPPSH